MRKLMITMLFLQVICVAYAQNTVKKWTEADRQYHLENLKRTKALLLKETENLTPEQWAFHESPDRWSIGQVVEHLGYWEIVFARDRNSAIALGKRDDVAKNALPDSAQLSFIMEEKPHVSSDFSRPIGLMKGEDNIKFFNNLRDQHIAFVQTTELDLRTHFRETAPGKFRDLHQQYIMHWGHVDRHLRQIRKIKTHPDYPRN